VTTLAVGFAAAVQPVSAQTIQTDAKGLVVGEVKIPVTLARCLRIARVLKGRAVPIVLVVQRSSACTSIRTSAGAWQGRYLAIAVELCAPDISKMTDSRRSSPRSCQVPDARVMSDLDAAVAWAGKPGKEPGRLGVTRFCWGSRIVYSTPRTTRSSRSVARSRTAPGGDE
jgi:carboxymethylenebutenolidase